MLKKQKDKKNISNENKEEKPKYGNLKNVNLSVSGEKDLKELQNGNVPFVIEYEKSLWCNLCGQKSTNSTSPLEDLRSHLVKSHGFNPALPIPILISPFESNEDYYSHYLNTLDYEMMSYEYGPALGIPRRGKKSDIAETTNKSSNKFSKTNDWDTIIHLKRLASQKEGLKFDIDTIKEEYSLDEIDIKILIALSVREGELRIYECERFLSALDAASTGRRDDWLLRLERLPIHFEDTQMSLVGYSAEHIQDVLEYRLRLDKLQRLGLIRYDNKNPQFHFPFRIQQGILKRIAGKKNIKIDRIKKREHMFRDYPELDRRGDDKLYEVYKPRVHIDRVILNEEELEKVKTFIAQWKNREKLFKSWGFDTTLYNGKCMSILLTGPPGVGKTLLAESIAHELQMKLLFIDYSKVISCWVGETSKAIVEVFKTAKEKNAVLLFDEVDALVSTRHEILTSTDKEFNTTVNVFLQEIEQFEGLVILTTNLASNLDSALERRIALKLHLNPPDEIQRCKIWKIHMPKNAPLDDDVSFEYLAKMFVFTGGQIKNAAINAARIALARNSEKISQDDFIKACKLELEGKDAFEYSIYTTNKNKKESKEGYI